MIFNKSINLFLTKWNLTDQKVNKSINKVNKFLPSEKNPLLHLSSPHWPLHEKKRDIHVTINKRHLYFRIISVHENV